MHYCKYLFNYAIVQDIRIKSESSSGLPTYVLYIWTLALRLKKTHPEATSVLSWLYT